MLIFGEITNDIVVFLKWEFLGLKELSFEGVCKNGDYIIAL